MDVLNEKSTSDEVVRTINALTEQVKANGAANEQTKAAFNEALNKQNQALDAINRSQAKAQYNQAGLDVDWYEKTARPEEMKRFPSCYLNGVRVKAHPGIHKGELHGVRFGLFDDPDAKNVAQVELQKTLSDRALTLAILRKHKLPEFTPSLDDKLLYQARNMGPSVEKIFVDGANIGAELLSSVQATDIERELNVPSGLAAIFAFRSMKSNSLTIPYIDDNIQAFNDAVPATDTVTESVLSSFATGENEIKSFTRAAAARVHRDADEDSIIAILPELMARLIEAHRFANDNTIINGSTAGTLDDIANWNVRGRTPVMTNDAKHQLRKWNGLRHYADAASTDSDLGAVKTPAGFRTVVNDLSVEVLVGPDGVANVCYLVTPEFFLSTMVAWTEYTGWDKAGPHAANLTGRLGAKPNILPNQVGWLDGMYPVILAYPLTSDLNASGVYDDTTTTKGSVLAVARNSYEYVVRRGAKTEVETSVLGNFVDVVTRIRCNFRPKHTGRTCVASGYNL